MENAIGIVDEANAGGNKDNLGIQTHTNSLIRFISSTNTPITVGIQGEWGSGKTSLINSIHYAFESEETVKQIWINSWEYSLLSTPEEALLKIVNRIIDELLESDTDVSRKTAIKEGAGKIFRGALRVGAQVALGTEAAKVANELLDSSGQSIATLRQQLTSLVKDIANRPSNPYKKVIVYVDDLDRIEPRNAVAILELLKNIFSVPNCVFILAIDYQVVVKGLEHKFGKQTPENEWEFRAFFDKIIQLPFMMPMGQYNIGKYVNSLLVGIGFVEGEGLDDVAIREIVLRTIGGNPRSIKRLANSVSLIQIFVKNKKEMSKEEDIVDSEEEGISIENEKFLLFALLCLQIAYPPIYSLLVQEPDFPKWDDALAFKETNRSEERSGDNERLSPDEMKKIFETEFEAAKKSDDFNEDWEQALYRICYGRPRMKPRVSDISKFFSYIKDELLSDQQEIIGETLARLLTQTSVTSVTSTDQGQQQPSTKSKWASEQQVNNLAIFRSEVLLSMKEAGSKIYGVRNVGKSFGWYMRFKCPPKIFSDPNFKPRWSINFFMDLGFKVTVEEIDEHIKIHEFFKLSFLKLKSELSNHGDLFFKDSNQKELSYILLRKNYTEIKSIEKKDVTVLVDNDEHRKDAIQWSTDAGIQFENVMMKLFQELINTHGSISR